MRKLLTQEEFEASIAGNFEEARNELNVEQVTPVYDVWREARVRVRPGLESEAHQAHATLSERVQGFLQLLSGSPVVEGTGQSPPDSDGLYLLLRHDGDRTYAGYANIYRGLKTLAPYLEDARFFITELYDSFVDEYRLSNGSLRFSRGDCGEDSPEAIQRYWARLLKAHPHDHDLRRFLARQQVYDGEFYTHEVQAMAPGKARRSAEARQAKAAFESALELDPENARAWKQKAQLHQLLGEHPQAAQCLERAAALGASPEVLQPLALTAFSDKRDADALSWLLRIPPEDRSRLSWQLAGHLHARAGDATAAAQAFATALRHLLDAPGNGPLNPDIEALYRTGRAEEVLVHYFEHTTARLESDATSTTRLRVVRDLVEWGEFFRIKTAHGFSPEQSRKLALGFYDRAIALGDPEGGAHYAKGLLRKHAGALEEARYLFSNAVEINPRHLEALGELAMAALEGKDPETAITRLKAYVELSARTQASSYYRQSYAARLSKALYDKANHLNDVVGDPVAAEATFDEIIALTPHLPTELRGFEGPWVGKANARAWRGEHAASLEFAEHALTLNPKSGYAWSAKGSALSNLRRYDEARPCYEKAIEAEPGYWHPYYCKACTLALTGGDRQTIYALIRKVLSLSPERREMLRHETDFTPLRGDPAFQALFDASPWETPPSKGKAGHRRKRR
jgi:tetratricopeptide (TPR) repeat protein